MIFIELAKVRKIDRYLFKLNFYLVPGIASFTAHFKYCRFCVPTLLNTVSLYSVSDPKRVFPDPDPTLKGIPDLNRVLYKYFRIRFRVRVKI